MGMDIVSVADGEIAEYWDEFDVMDLLRQIDVIPHLGTAPDHTTLSARGGPSVTACSFSGADRGQEVPWARKPRRKREPSEPRRRPSKRRGRETGSSVSRRAGYWVTSGITCWDANPSQEQI